MVLNLGFEAFLNGTKTIRKMREKYDCNVPWLILMDPTSAVIFIVQAAGQQNMATG